MVLILISKSPLHGLIIAIRASDNSSKYPEYVLISLLDLHNSVGVRMGVPAGGLHLPNASLLRQHYPSANRQPPSSPTQSSSYPTHTKILTIRTPFSPRGNHHPLTFIFTDVNSDSPFTIKLFKSQLGLLNISCAVSSLHCSLFYKLADLQ